MILKIHSHLWMQDDLLTDTRDYEEKSVNKIFYDKNGREA